MDSQMSPPAEKKDLKLLIKQLEEALEECNAVAKAFNRVSYSVVENLALARALTTEKHKTSEKMDIDELLLCKMENLPLSQWLYRDAVCSVVVEDYRILFDGCYVEVQHHGDLDDVSYIIHTAKFYKESPLYVRIRDLHEKITNNKALRLPQLKEKFVGWLNQ